MESSSTSGRSVPLRPAENQVQVQIKEVKLRPKTDDHDIGVKVRHARRFLEQGNKVKVTIRFRGRELAHRDIGVSAVSARGARSVRSWLTSRSILAWMGGRCS